MSSKKSKKLKQMYARAVRDEATKTISQMGGMIKPKPDWMPMFVYRWCLSVVLR